jgi:hypothetical protein
MFLSGKRLSIREVIDMTTIMERVVEFKDSETLKTLAERSKQMEKIMEAIGQGYEPCLDLFFNIFQKLNPKKKILDIPLLPKDPDVKIVLHQFGFFLKKPYKERAEPVDKENLFSFFRDNKPETFEKVADEINYRHMRIAFRDFCRIMNAFIKENKHKDADGTDEVISVKIPFKKEILTHDGEKTKVTSIDFEGYESGMTICIHLLSNSIDDIELGEENLELDNILILEQIQKEVLEGTEKLLKKVKDERKNKGSVVSLYEQLQEKFSNFIMADEL